MTIFLDRPRREHTSEYRETIARQRAPARELPGFVATGTARADDGSRVSTRDPAAGAREA